MLKKFLRLMYLVVLFIALLPLWMVFAATWLFVCMRAARLLDMPTKEGFKAWIDYIYAGLEMNKDFIKNGL